MNSTVQSKGKAVQSRWSDLPVPDLCVQPRVEQSGSYDNGESHSNSLATWCAPCSQMLLISVDVLFLWLLLWGKSIASQPATTQITISSCGDDETISILFQFWKYATLLMIHPPGSCHGGFDGFCTWLLWITRTSLCVFLSTPKVESTIPPNKLVVKLKDLWATVYQCKHINLGLKYLIKLPLAKIKKAELCQHNKVLWLVNQCFPMSCCQSQGNFRWIHKGAVKEWQKSRT